MIEVGTKVHLEISEPWDVNKALDGTIVRKLNSDQYFIIKDNESDEMYIVTHRYKRDRLSDIEKGSKVIVGIASPHADLDLLAIQEITPDAFQILDYRYIGSMKLSG